jgi:VanZ family protein
MNRAANLCSWWLPVIVWMATIFIFSTDWFAAGQTAPWLATLLPLLPPNVLDGVHFTLRKSGHFGEYFILAVLLLRAWRQQFPGQSPAKRIILVSLLAALYAVTDEWHQSFVPNRSASAMDVLIDAGGAFWGAFWFDWKARRSTVK